MYDIVNFGNNVRREVMTMEDMEQMEICECGNITYMVKEHFQTSGDLLQVVLEKITLRQIDEAINR